MKDNEKNLSNEVLESVAGGVWTKEQLDKLFAYCDGVKWADDPEGLRWTWRAVERAKQYDSPADFVQHAEYEMEEYGVDEDVIKFVKENLC